MSHLLMNLECVLFMSKHYLQKIFVSSITQTSSLRLNSMQMVSTLALVFAHLLKSNFFKLNPNTDLEKKPYKVFGKMHLLPPESKTDQIPQTSNRVPTPPHATHHRSPERTLKISHSLFSLYKGCFVQTIQKTPVQSQAGHFLSIFSF